MWPWEHAIVGYLAYSLVCHAFFRASPGGLEAFAVVAASVMPDIIDKPLSWQFGLFDAGYALGHSIFFAVPFTLLVGALARSVGRTRAGVAFGLGYLLHPPSDVLDTLVREGIFLWRLAFWPVVPVPASDPSTGFLAQFAYYFDRYWTDLLAGDISTYLWVQFGLAGCALLVWLYDGAPVLRETVLGVKRLFVGSARGGRG
ncbi:metal-dependent hydrolase [Natrialbaceae archaeon GCM10025810]|uniref:metal-dependent hydrolase n=1 Tax=Halovalidus salilacus TaxID=3075124 RepID=UPI003622DC99